MWTPSNMRVNQVRNLMLWRCKEGIRSQGTGIASGYEQLHVGAGN